MSRQRVVTRVAIGILFAGLALITVRGLDHPVGNGDEVIYAQNVREMIRTADYTTLRWHGTEVLQRPAAPFVLASVGARIVDGEVGLRLTSALSSFVILVLVYWIALRAWGRHDAAAIAALLCASVPSFHVYSRALLSDPPFVAAAVAALGGTLWAQRDRRGLMIAGAGLGAAVAFKSLAAALPALALAPWLVIAARRRGDMRSIGIGIGLFVVLAAPFYINGFVEHGARFWHEHIGYSLWARAKGDLQVGMPGGVTAYARHLYATNGFVVVAWLAAGSVGASAWAWRTRDRDLGLLAGYALFLFVALSVIGTRLPHYLLPVFPAAALAIGCGYARFAERSERMKSPLYAALGPALAVTLLVSGITRDGPEQHLLPSPPAHTLGVAARQVAGPDETVYALEWYAPAFGYYADRRFRIVTGSRRLFAILDDVDFFRAAGVPVMAPPAPAPIGASILVAGPREALAATPWLAVETVLEQAGPFELVRARIVGAPRPPK